MQTTEDTHWYASLQLRAFRQQMGKMVDPGLSVPTTHASASVPEVPRQAQSSRELGPFSP